MKASILAKKLIENPDFEVVFKFSEIGYPVGRKTHTDKITEIVAVNMLSLLWVDQIGPNDTFIPPTKEQAIKEYQNSPMFNRAVESTVVAISGVVSQQSAPHINYRTFIVDDVIDIGYSDKIIVVSGEEI